MEPEYLIFPAIAGPAFVFGMIIAGNPRLARYALASALIGMITVVASYFVPAEATLLDELIEAVRIWHVHILFGAAVFFVGVIFRIGRIVH